MQEYAWRILFDLFNTLVLLENNDAFYMPSFKRLHLFLDKNEIDIPFEAFVRVYFEVRDRLYAEKGESLEDPHFNIRVSSRLEKIGCKPEVSDPIVVGATGAFCEEFMKFTRAGDDAMYWRDCEMSTSSGLSRTCPFLNALQGCRRSLV